MRVRFLADTRVAGRWYEAGLPVDVDEATARRLLAVGLVTETGPVGGPVPGGRDPVARYADPRERR